ncbi:cell wall-binding repeat-containing protein, partial [Ilumatobacter sp.]|uniref:cell wall-binding repeat-containing protein n=1 Tax=Ilumatobacter sp. TaxID=1967498 RepID=UPI003C596690
SRNSIPEPTVQALAHLQPRRIVVVGGSSAVSDAVLTRLRQYTSGTVARVAGADRFATAVALSRSRFPTGAGTVFVATGRNFADALSAAPAAARLNAPLLLVGTNRIPPSTLAELNRLNPTRIVLLGGLGAASASVFGQLGAIATTERIAGADRYGTSAAVAAHFFPTAVSTVFLATGENFPDALAAGAAAAQVGGAVLLVRQTCVGHEGALQLTRLAPVTAVVLGGTGALSDNVARLGTCPTTSRYLGEGPLAAIRSRAAIVAAEYRAAGCTSIDSDRLAAMMISPIFKESGAATTAATAPSPMTLSRYDEWNGLRNQNTNASGNLGLYAFANPATTYYRAFWHPGIGMWQYDSAGVGAPFTAIARMDVNIVGNDVARGMAGRYCAATGTAGQPPTEQQRRDRAWSPWFSPGQKCPLCQREYAALMLQPGLPTVLSVPGITSTGGAVSRTCRVGGATLPCWYVNPSVSVIQGNNWWARLDPTGGAGPTPGQTNPTVVPTPLSFPFYVLENNGREERHWLRADTGYNIDISASRILNANARPRPGQVNSGVQWSGVSTLCDLTTNRGACAIQVTSAPESFVPPSDPILAPSDSSG